MAWIVVTSKPNVEFRAEQDLADVAGYCPKRLHRIRPRKMHGRTLLKAYPRWPGYLFAKDDRAGVAALIRRSTTLCGFIRLGDEIGKVSDAMIEELRAADSLEPEEVQPESFHLSIGDQVIVIAGVLAGRQGMVTRLSPELIGVDLDGAFRRTSIRRADLVLSEA